MDCQALFRLEAYLYCFYIALPALVRLILQAKGRKMNKRLERRQRRKERSVEQGDLENKGLVDDSLLLRLGIGS